MGHIMKYISLLPYPVGLLVHTSIPWPCESSGKMFAVGVCECTCAYWNLLRVSQHLYSLTHGEFQVELPEPQLREITAFTQCACTKDGLWHWVLNTNYMITVWNETTGDWLGNTHTHTHTSYRWHEGNNCTPPQVEEDAPYTLLHL